MFSGMTFRSIMLEFSSIVYLTLPSLRNRACFRLYPLTRTFVSLANYSCDISVRSSVFLSHLHDNQQVHNKDERRQKGSREFIGGDKVSVESIPPNKVTYYSSGDNCRGNNKHNPEQIDSCVSSSPNLPQTFVPVWIQLVLKKQKYEKTSINMLSFKVNLAGGLQFSK